MSTCLLLAAKKAATNQYRLPFLSLQIMARIRFGWQIGRRHDKRVARVEAWYLY